MKSEQGKTMPARLTKREYWSSLALALCASCTGGPILMLAKEGAGGIQLRRRGSGKECLQM